MSLEKEMETHSSILAWRIPWTEKPGWLYSIGSQRVRHDQAINTSLHFTRDIVQEAVIKTIPKKNKCKKAKWLSEKDLQLAEKRKEAKDKGEKERYIHLNAEFQKTARRDKKAFLSEQRKEIDKNKRMGKTRDLLKIPREHFKQRWAQ